MTWEKVFSGHSRRLARQMSSRHEDFIRSIAENPQDTLRTRVYADFLEEEGMDKMASVLRRAADHKDDEVSKGHTNLTAIYLAKPHSPPYAPDEPMTVMYRRGVNLGSVSTPHPDDRSSALIFSPKSHLDKKEVDSLRDEGHPVKLFG